jgi:hypothetical protein
MILDKDHVIRCDITPNRARCIIGKPFADPLGISSPGKRRKENIRISRFSRCNCWISGRAEGNQEIGSESEDEPI